MTSEKQQSFSNTPTTESPSTVVTVAEPVEKALVAGMLQPYLTEMSQHTGQKPMGNGRFQYPYLELYWYEAQRQAFLICSGHHVVGFALVRQSQDTNIMAEFFIKPEYRHRGHGRRAALSIFKHMPGRWLIHQQITDFVGQTFWRRVINSIDSKYAERIENTKAGKSVTVQRFFAPELVVDLTDQA